MAVASGMSASAWPTGASYSSMRITTGLPRILARSVMAWLRFAPGEIASSHAHCASVSTFLTRTWNSALKASSDVALTPAKENWRMG